MTSKIITNIASGNTRENQSGVELTDEDLGQVFGGGIIAAIPAVSPLYPTDPIRALPTDPIRIW